MDKTKKKVYKNDHQYIEKVIENLWINKNKILKNILYFLAIGIAYSLFLPNTYKSSSSFYPHYQNLQNENSSLRNIAGLAGINLSQNLSNEISPTLYPELIKSTTFKKKILDENIIFNNETKTYKNYLLDKQTKKFNLKYIITFPLKFLRENINNEKKYSYDQLTYISDEEFRLFKQLDDNIIIDVDEMKGDIELSVFDENPEISSLIAIKANKLLQNTIIDLKVKNVKDVLNFTIEQLNVAKKNLFTIEDKLADFKDSNIRINSDLFKNNLNRLQTEYDIAKNIYNELALTKERNAIDVRKNTPIFTIINPVAVPNKKSYPNRILIVIFFSFLGFLSTTIYLIIKEDFIKVRKKLKNLS